MLKGNLSTRPFYNERLVMLALLTVAVLSLALGVYSATRIIALSQRHGELKAQIDAADAEAKRIEGAATALQAKADLAGLKLLGVSTREANQLIDQRTFSWTALFTLIEKTLPLDARLVEVAPRIDKNGFLLGMVIVAKTLDDIMAFIDALEATAVFHDVVMTESSANDDRTLTATLYASYRPEPTPTAIKAGGSGAAAGAAPEAAPAGATPSGATAPGATAPGAAAPGTTAPAATPGAAGRRGGQQ